MNVRLLTIIISLWCVCVVYGNAQTTEEVFGKIAQHLSRADAQALATHFNDFVDITIGDKEQNYPKSQAVFVMREFFTNYPVRSFVIMHKGSSGDTYYAIGEYQSTKGKYDTNVFIKKIGGVYMIEQMRFEQDN